MPQSGDERGLVARSWTHSHEEDTGSARVYRPSDQQFPPSRGRSAVTLNPDGSLLLGAPGADDRSVVADGRWSLAGHRLTLTPTSGAAQAFEVESVVPDRLVLRPLE